MNVLVLTIVLAATGQIASDIKSDEEVVFFPTYGCMDKEQHHWHIPIHGWIYEPETTSLTRRALLALLRKKLGLEREESETELFMRRARLFLVDNERGKDVSIQFGAKVLALWKSRANGHTRTPFKFSRSSFRKLLQGQAVQDGWCCFHAITRKGDKRVFRGAVQLIPPTGVSVISDIDDTIKISEVRDRKALVRNTFLREFEAAPGMGALYRQWAKAGARFHYVSASPWQLYTPLRDFVGTNGFPLGSFDLRYVRWKDSSLLEFLESSEKYKLETIERIFDDLPQRKFILVGDSGEKDPEVYGTIARKYPKQVVGIFIRNVTDEAADAERFRSAFDKVPAERWTVFRHAAEIAGRASALLK